MQEVVHYFKDFHANRRRVTTMENGIMLSVIAVILIIAIGTFANAITSVFSTIALHLIAGA